MTGKNLFICLFVCLFITGKCTPGYPNVAMPPDGGVHTHSMSEVQSLTNEPMRLQRINL